MIREILKLLGRDSQLVQALNECYQMLDLCQTMVRSSVDSLRQRDDGSVDVDIAEMDIRVNKFERDVRRKIMTHLSLGNTADIASGLTIVSVVIDVERIGDYAKNICDLAVAHPGKFHGGAHEEDLAAIEVAALENFERSAVAFKTGDVDESRVLMKEYKSDISSQCKELEKELVAGRTDLSASDAVTLALYLRFLKRISAHSRNLISSLVNPIDRIGYSEKEPE